jgi:light-regulated signal transduction histidine kinase (bacteriophytochrome)
MDKSAQSPRILIVDDEVANVNALCDTLRDQGYEATGLTSGDAALDALQHNNFDLLLADLMMPTMSGIDLLRAALQIDPMLVGIIMTGEGSIASAVQAMQSGALDFILKPFNLSAILPALARGLALRNLRAENASLATHLSERAAELEAANRELDAFTRSVSHDLRTPLHGIISLLDLLKVELPQLSHEARKLFDSVETSAQHMNQLIGDLMRLSRLDLHALQREMVDPATLAQDILDELRDREPQRQVVLNLGELPPVQADPPLLRQLFTNLLSNAYKFTRHKAAAEITVGSEIQGMERIYYIRDNGAGFDMAHAEKLFGVFQRLHRPEEFEGTGIGLTIVQRIVQRHGGRIWANAKSGQGATFYFTLSPTTKKSERHAEISCS